MCGVRDIFLIRSPAVNFIDTKFHMSSAISNAHKNDQYFTADNICLPQQQHGPLPVYAYTSKVLLPYNKR